MLRRKRPRTYAGENISDDLVHWLNETQRRPENRRVATLLRAAQDLQHVWRTGDFPRLNLRTLRMKRPTRAQRASQKRYCKLASRLNRLLSRYRFRPRYRYNSGNRMRISWNSPFKSARIQIGTWAGGNFDTYPFAEGDAIQSVVRLAESGYLGRLRTCHCGNWLYARVKHKRFCGTACQQSRFRRTDEFRAIRRKYMRRYREKHTGGRRVW